MAKNNSESVQQLMVSNVKTRSQFQAIVEVSLATEVYFASKVVADRVEEQGIFRAFLLVEEAIIGNRGLFPRFEAGEF